MTNHLSIICRVALFALALPAVAQNSSVEPDTIVVTGSMRPIAIAEVASSVTIIEQQEIRRREARNVTDLLRTVPGFSLSQSGVLGSQVQLRSRGAEANHILVLVNGVEANDPSGADEFRFELLAASDVERIEIIRGPQSALYGSEAVAGVINIITRRDRPGSGISGYAETGSDNALDIGVSGHSEWAGWNVNAGLAQTQTDGENTSRVGDEDDGFERMTANIDAIRQLSDDSRLTLGLRYVDAQTDFDGVDFFVTGLPSDGDRVSDAQRFYTNVRYDLNVNDLAHQLRLDFTDTDTENRVDGNFSDAGAAEKLNLAYRLSMPVGPDTFTVQLAHERTDFEQRGLALFGDPNQDQSIDLTGLTTEYLLRRWSDWVITFGASFESNSDFDDLLSGRLGAVYSVSPTQRLRLNVGTGRKAPTFTERFGFFPQQFVGNPDLEPENSVSFEVGATQTFANDRVSVDLTYFNQTLDDEINGFVFDPDLLAFTSANEDGESRRRGLELITTASPVDGVDLMFNYTYLDATEPRGGVRLDEVRRPRHQGSVAAAVALPGARWSLQMNADYSGRRLDQFFPPFPQPSQFVALDPYWLVDMTVKFHVSQQWDVFVRASNLFDEDYENVFGFNTPGRAVFVGARFSQGDR